MTTSIIEKGGGGFEGVSLLLCENPLPPLPAAIEAAGSELPRSNHYTEPFSAPLRLAIARRLDVPDTLVHINAGSELILRQLFAKFGRHPHLLTPTYRLFPEIAPNHTETRLRAEDDFRFALDQLEIPAGTTLVAIVNPNNPNGGIFDMTPLPDLLRRHPDVCFLVDEAFIELGGTTVTPLVPAHPNLVVTRTFSKAHSLAGFRVGYAIGPQRMIEELNASNDAYPLARASQAAALANLRHHDEIDARSRQLKTWARELANGLERLDVKTYPTDTYFFLADVSPLNAEHVCNALRQRRILAKPLADPNLSPGLIRVTTSTPDNNTLVLDAIQQILRTAKARPHRLSEDEKAVIRWEDEGGHDLQTTSPARE
jgi:histidinol-phosphate aminotransferase